MNHPRILGIGTANPPARFTQEQSFHAAGYQSERIRKIFLNSDIDYRHFYLEGAPNREESSDQLNQRYLRGAMKTGCQAILNCLKASATAVQDIDFLAVCTCTGYVCPDVSSRLIAHMGFSNRVQRASILGLGCAGALPSLEGSLRGRWDEESPVTKELSFNMETWSQGSLRYCILGDAAAADINNLAELLKRAAGS